MTDRRPQCPTCGAPVDRLQRSRGVVATYPCQCWLDPATARGLAVAHRVNTAIAAELLGAKP